MEHPLPPRSNTDLLVFCVGLDRHRTFERFNNVDLHPDKVDNPTMGTIFDELIRKFNEALNENPGEHFTPRDVVHLIVRPSRSMR